MTIRIGAAVLVAAACGASEPAAPAPPFPGPCEVSTESSGPGPNPRYLYSYDRAGRELSVARDDDGDGRWDGATLRIRDRAGREIAVMHAGDAGVEHWEYDAAGRPVRRTIERIDARAAPPQVVELAYDAAGRLIRRGDASWWTEYRHDDAGRVIEEREVDARGQSHGQTLRTYDDRGRVVEVRTTDEIRGEPTGSWMTTQFTYDAADRVQTERASRDGRPIGETKVRSAPDHSWSERETYDGAGGLTQVTRTTYDARGNEVAWEQRDVPAGAWRRRRSEYTCWLP